MANDTQAGSPSDDNASSGIEANTAAITHLADVLTQLIEAIRESIPFELIDCDDDADPEECARRRALAAEHAAAGAEDTNPAADDGSSLPIVPIQERRDIGTGPCCRDAPATGRHAKPETDLADVPAR